MRALKIKLYQNMVNYGKEMSYGYVQTYPLPTPSMVKGMAHSLLELNEYKNLKISIQGTRESVVTNMQKIIKFDRSRSSRPNNPYDVTIGNSKPKTALHGVMFVDQIVDIELVLHICFDDTALNEKLLNAVRQKTVVLGRNEDIARVDFEMTKLVELEERESAEIDLNHDMFMPKEFADEWDVSGIHYRLPFYYEDVKSFLDKRIFKFVDSVYVTKGCSVEDCDFPVDEDGDLAAFLELDNHE